MSNKQLKLALGILSLGFAAYIYFFPPTHTTSTVVEQKTVTKFDTITNNCFDCTIDDLHGETAGEFMDVTARYRSLHQDLYNKYVKGTLSSTNMGALTYTKASTFLDARSCWFAADTLKKFICLMEQYAAKIKIPSSQLGVRFYYATYPDGFTKAPQYANNHTLYLTPTALDPKTSRFVDFEPRKSAANGRLTYLSDFLKDTLNQLSQQYFIKSAIVTQPSVQFKLPDNSTINVSMNMGDLCPPGTGCNTTLNKIDGTYPSMRQ